jgi:hypothetical protein
MVIMSLILTYHLCQPLLIDIYDNIIRTRDSAICDGLFRLCGSCAVSESNYGILFYFYQTMIGGIISSGVHKDRAIMS